MDPTKIGIRVGPGLGLEVRSTLGDIDEDGLSDGDADGIDKP